MAHRLRSLRNLCVLEALKVVCLVKFNSDRKTFLRRMRVIHELAFPKEEGYVGQGGQDCAE